MPRSAKPAAQRRRQVATTPVTPHEAISEPPVGPPDHPRVDYPPVDAQVEALVHELIGRVADKWTMIVLEVLAEHGELRFTRLSELAGGISPKMLTQTVRQMERDGLLTRTVHPVIPPRVEYRLTELGLTLGAAFCGVWIWAEQNIGRIADARRAFDGAQRRA